MLFHAKLIMFDENVKAGINWLNLGDQIGIDLLSVQLILRLAIQCVFVIKKMAEGMTTGMKFDH
jgi:hypothetical protein